MPIYLNKSSNKYLILRIGSWTVSIHQEFRTSEKFLIEKLITDWKTRVKEEANWRETRRGAIQEIWAITIKVTWIKHDKRILWEIPDQ